MYPKVPAEATADDDQWLVFDYDCLMQFKCKILCVLKTKIDCQQSVCSSMLLQEVQNESQLVII